MIDLLCYHLLKAESHEKWLDPFVKNKTALDKVAQLPKLEEDHFWMILHFICIYYDKHRELPTISGIRDFVKNSRDLQITESWTTALTETLKSLPEMDEVRIRQAKDPNVIIETAIHDGRVLWELFLFERARDIAVSGPAPKPKPGQKKKLSGADDAKQFLVHELSKDVTCVGSDREGVWQENIEAVALKLNEYLSQKQKRILSGYKQIDNQFVMRIGKTLVIMGNSGDGKTLFLTSMVYNMARNGERILYNALEFTVDETWEALTFIHQRSLIDRYPLPPKHKWMMHDPQHNPIITDRDINYMTEVMRDLHNGGVPGLIDVCQRWTLEDFLAYYEANDPQRHYSVVVIDYASHLRLENNYRNEGERQAAIDNICSRLVSWTHEQNKFLFITPAQVSKTAAKDAIKRFENKDDEVGDSGYTLDSLYYGSALKQDGDLSISVFSPDDLKDKNEMQVKCHKYRHTRSFGNITLKVDTDHEYVFDEGDPAMTRVMQPIEDGDGDTISIGDKR
jgi:hypothetical protein